MARSDSARSPNAIDKHVGIQIRLRRLMIGMSQTSLADELGITFQQIQKYEKGRNRVGGGRLYKLSWVLDVPVSYFYKGLAPTFSTPAHD